MDCGRDGRFHQHHWPAAILGCLPRFVNPFNAQPVPATRDEETNKGAYWTKVNGQMMLRGRWKETILRGKGEEGGGRERKGEGGKKQEKKNQRRRNRRNSVRGDEKHKAVLALLHSSLLPSTSSHVSAPLGTRACIIGNEERS